MTNKGRDYLGAPYFRKVVMQSHLHGYGGGVFWETFNHGKHTGKACVVEWAKEGPSFMPFIRVQGLWAGSSHSYKGKEKAALNIAEELANIAVVHGEIKFYYSPFCENKDAPTEFLLKLKQEFPILRIVHTANKGAGLVKGVINETHGDYRPKGMSAFSYDGLSIVNADVEMFKEATKDCEYAMDWNASDNGRRNDSPSAPAIPNRKHWTSNKMNESIFYQSTNTRAADSLKKGLMGKSHGDPDTVPNPRDDNKYVMLSPHKSDEIQLLNGTKPVEKLKYSGKSHEDGRYIYRSNKWGCEIAKKGRKLTVKQGGKLYGQVDPGFRVNEYRNKV